MANLIRRTIIAGVLAVLVLATPALPALAAEATRLGPVWARIADFKGELGSVESAEFSPDSRYVVAATKFNFEIVKFRVSDGVEMWRIATRDEIEHAQFSPDGRFIVAGGEDATTRVYDAATGAEIAAYFHDQSVDSVTWSPDGKLIFAGEEDYKDAADKRWGKGRVLRFDAATGTLELLATTDNDATHNGIAFAPDMGLAATTSRQFVRLWDVADGFAEARVLEARVPDDPDATEEVRLIAANFSAGGAYLVAGDRNGHIFVWETEGWSLVRHMNQTGRKIETIDFSPDGRYVTHAGHTPHLWLWHMADVLNTELASADMQPAHVAWANANAEDLNYSADGHWLVSAHQDGGVRLWVPMNDDPMTATNAHAALMAEQARRDWGAANAAEQRPAQ